MELDKVIVKPEQTIKEAMKKIDLNGFRIAVVVDEGKFQGIVVDGDIRSAIVKGVDVGEPISVVMNTNPILLKQNELGDANKVSNAVLEIINKKSEYIPIIDDNGKFLDLKHYKELQNGDVSKDVNSGALKSVLVVGGAGYIGSILCRKLLNKGYKVRVLDLFMFGEDSLLELYQNKKFEKIKGDVRNIETVSNAIRGVDAVIHLAAIVGDPACKSLPVNTIETNYLATRALAEACKYHQINRFLFASTCSVYGIGEEKLGENSPLKPVSLYARSKIKSEEALMNMMDENFSPCVLRMGTIYGLSPRMRFDLVVNTFVKNALLKGELTVFGGEQYRPLVHVEDVAEAFVKALEAPLAIVKGQKFNVGTDEQNYKIKQVAEKMKQIHPTVKINISEKEADKRNYIVDFMKIKGVLGLNASKTIEQGMKEIKEAIECGKIENPEDPKHYNVGE